MNTHADKTSENKSQAVANSLTKLESSGESTFQFVDNRPEAIAQRKLQEMANNSPRALQLKALQEMANNSPQAKQAAQLKAIAKLNTATPIQQKKENGITQLANAPEEEDLIQGKFDSVQRQGNEFDSKSRENKTGLPDNLKSGIENLSDYSMDDVKVHYNSDKPAQLQAHAYAQGTDIHLASGQEKHLAHEAWHVVQQAQGRVKPTMQVKAGVPVNDEVGLDTEYDLMGAKVNSLGVDGTLQKRDNDTTSIYMGGMKTKAANMSLVRQRVTDDPVVSAALDSDTEAVKTDVNSAMTKLKTMILNNQGLLDQLDKDGRDRQIYAPIQSLWRKMDGLLASWDASWSTEDTCGLMLDIGLQLGRSVQTTAPYIMTNEMKTSRRDEGVKGSNWEQEFIPEGTRTQSGVSATTIRLLKTLSLNNNITALEIEAVMNGVCMYWDHSIVKKITGEYHTTAEVWATYNNFLLESQNR